MKNLNIHLLTLGTILAVVLMAPSSARAQSAAAIYKTKCAGCHGVDGKGNSAAGKALGAHDFSSAEVTKMSDTDLITIVTAGKKKMPAFGKSLKEADIKALVAYIRGLGT
jgi:cytochrome c6